MFMKHVRNNDIIAVREILTQDLAMLAQVDAVCLILYKKCLRFFSLV